MKTCHAVAIAVRKFLKKEIVLTRMKRHSSSSSKSEVTAKKGHWRAGLLDSMKDPKFKVKEDDKVVVIKDLYPKSRHHFLVLPKNDIHSINEVRKEHEELLEHMEIIGTEVANEHSDYEFIIGYHAVPSMYRLHLHVVSTDFDSPCLKNKYHWNSFTTPYFKPSKAVREDLQKNGHVTPMNSKDRDLYLNKSLVCHKCSYQPKNFPDLKKHLLTHLPKNLEK